MPSPTLQRMERLVGAEVLSSLASVRIILFGLGGVGSWCAEALVRSGVRHLTLVDPDRVCASNVNRQLPALPETIGRPKAEVLRERLLAICPEAEVDVVTEAFTDETAGRFDLERFDYILDAIDSLKDKAALIRHGAAARGTFFSSMGAALKLDPTRVRVAAFADVRGCPLGSALRKKLRREHAFPEKSFLCVYSDEVLPNRGSCDETELDPRKAVINGSYVGVTGTFGFALASLVLQDLCGQRD